MGNAKHYDVVALGELLIDFTQNGKSGQGNELFEANPGGAPCNVLAMLSRFGKKTAFIGKVGNDMFGKMLKKSIEEAGIDSTGLKMDEKVPTTLAFVHTQEDGDRDFSFYRNPGADMMLRSEDLGITGETAADTLFGDCRIFHIGSLSMTDEGCERATREAVEYAKANGALISFDPNLREPLWDSLDKAHEKIAYGLSQCDILKISDNEITWFTGRDDIEDAAEGLLRTYTPKLMVVTLGRDGSIAYYKGRRYKSRAFYNTDTIETTGAGDTFCAGILNTVLDRGLDQMQDADIERMLVTAGAAASLITARKGALRVMPTVDDIEAFLDKYRYGKEANRRFLKEQAAGLLNFGMRFPSPQGSSYYLGDDGTPNTERPRETWITARMVHVYSLGLRLGHKGAAKLVAAGLKGLTGELHDREKGGYFAGIDADGNALEGKQCYAHAFVILAACSALKAAEETEETETMGEAEATARALLNDALEVYDRYFWNEEEGLSCDTWDTGFKVCEPYRGINANMHSVEAFLAVADVTGREEYRERAGRIIDHVIGWAKTNDWRIPEHFSADWKAEPEYNKDKKDDRFKPYGATPGHGIEWARLITQWAVSVFKTEADGGQTDGLSRADGMARYIEAACNLYDRAVSDAWSDRVPGIAYTTDWNGEPVIRDRMHWTLAEAINTSSVLYRVTGNEKYAADYEKFIRYLDRYVMDHKNGSWFHQLDGDNNVIGTVWPGKPDLYHAVQAMLIPYADIDRSVIFINR